MNRLMESNRTTERELEIIMESLACRRIDAETAKNMIARIVGRREQIPGDRDRPDILGGKELTE